jgi:hypothetical protein
MFFVECTKNPPPEPGETVDRSTDTNRHTRRATRTITQEQQEQQQQQSVWMGATITGCVSSTNPKANDRRDTFTPYLPTSWNPGFDLQRHFVILSVNQRKAAIFYSSIVVHSIVTVVDT